MGYATLSAARPALASGCYRLTIQGRAFVDLVETPEQTIGSLSRYLHDVLMLCGTGTWFEQLRQFMPPRSLEESLQALLALGLIEQVSLEQSPRHAAPPNRSEYAPRPVTALAQRSHI